jgi:hypothetical protein
MHAKEAGQRVGGRFHHGEDLSIRNPTVFFSDLVQEPNVGRGVLRSWAVTFDQPNMRVQFSPPGPGR